MIIGECYYCEYINMTAVGPVGTFCKRKCDGCDKEYWIKTSRTDPEIYHIDHFFVNEKGNLELKNNIQQKD